ncbi:MAG: ABC transporter substrate-binding protein [Clostridia bacterium]|nr:ABC transporter substrate-binding protein [Clostridia bacterium]
MKKRFGSILTACVLASAFALTACGGPAEESESHSGGGNEPAATAKGILSVGYSNFNEKFSPFFATTAYDQDVATMTQVSLLASDRVGAVVEKSKTGEKRVYNGTEYTYNGLADLTIEGPADNGEVVYTFDIRNDVKFSDGVALTADDVIFTMYAYSDPTYDGSSSFFALPIKGMNEYRAGISAKWQLILADLAANVTANLDAGYYTAADKEAFEAAFAKAGANFAQSIVDYCKAYGAETVAQGAALWGFAGLAEDATAADFFAVLLEKYGYDISDEGLNYEKADTSFSSFLTEQLDDAMLKGVKTGESAANIAGIEKTGDYQVKVTLTEVDATAIYQLPITVTPLHYYGDKEKYDYADNKFGFEKGDLSAVRAKTTKPLGAGPYKFDKYENGVVYFVANEDYFLGAPKTKYIHFVESNDKDKINGVVTGTIDLTDPSFDNDAVKAIKDANSNGTLYGDKITINAVDNLGYGYIGMSAKAVKVGNDGASEASKNLRKGLATIFAVYRELAVSSYYGDRASVINYPISNTSWAAPQPADEGYEVAFSRDADGKAIYTSNMTAEEKYAAAKAAALGFLAKAGYTVEGGKVTAAPEGAKLEYTAWIPADGTGDHPSFMILSEAKQAFAEIGINLIIKDLANSSELWTSIEADQVDIWCAAWGATVDPDMYQIYFSGMDGKAAGGSNYMYDIADDDLNALILNARKSLDQADRKEMYKDCLDIIIDWAVEIPVYQRQNVIIFSPERVKMDTVTKDITTFYGWMSEIEKLEVYDETV